MELQLTNKTSSYSQAFQTASQLKECLLSRKWDSQNELLEILNFEILKICNERRNSFIIKNVAKQLKKIISDGCRDDTADIRESVLSLVYDFIVGIETSCNSIADQATEHVHANEIILTVGYSGTVKAFLKSASKKRRFHVIVVENAPSYSGHQMAKELANENIQTTIILDSAVFAIMARVNKVVIGGVSAILANGAIIVNQGVHLTALSAKHHSVPLICLSALYKLTPLFLSSDDHSSFNKLISPENVLEPQDGVNVVCPMYDFVPPELITLFVTGASTHSHALLYKLVQDLYLKDSIGELER